MHCRLSDHPTRGASKDSPARYPHSASPGGEPKYPFFCPDDQVAFMIFARSYNGIGRSRQFSTSRCDLVALVFVNSATSDQPIAALRAGHQQLWGGDRNFILDGENVL